MLTISSGALSSTLINHVLGPEINQTTSHPNPIKNKHTDQKPTTYHPRNQQQKLSGYQQRMDKQNWQRPVADFATFPITQHNQFIEKNPTFLCYFSNWHFRLCLPRLLKWSLPLLSGHLGYPELPPADGMLNTHTPSPTRTKSHEYNPELLSVPGTPRLLACWALTHEGLSKQRERVPLNERWQGRQNVMSKIRIL